MPRFAKRKTIKASAEKKVEEKEEEVEETAAEEPEEPQSSLTVEPEAPRAKQLSPFEQKLNDLVSLVFGRVPFVQRMFFVHHMQIMIKAGLSIVAALKILEAEIENKKLKMIAGIVRRDVEKGQQLSEAMSKFPRIFAPVYVSMIGAGETAGKMEDALAQVSTQMKKSHALTSTIKGAMIYPAVIVVAMIGISIEVVVFVLPKLIVMFKEFDTELPLATKILIWITETVGRYGIFMAIGIVALIILMAQLYKNTKVKRTVHLFNLYLPIAGPIFKKINLARFTMTLSSLLQSTIPIIEAVKITAGVQGNLIYREKLLLVAEELKKGETMSKLLAAYPRIFPPMVTEMVMVGEESGKVEDMLTEMADYYSDEVDSVMKNFSTIIEPVIILIMGLAVAGIAVAVIMPMYSLAQSF